MSENGNGRDKTPCSMVAPVDSLPTNDSDMIRNAGTDAVLDWTGTRYVIMIERGLRKELLGSLEIVDAAGDIGMGCRVSGCVTFRNLLTRENDGGCVTSVVQSHDLGHLIFHTHHLRTFFSLSRKFGNTTRSVS